MTLQNETLQEGIAFGALDGGLNKLAEIRKALEVGYETNPSAMNGYASMKMESIDTTLKMAIADEKTAKFWKHTRKTKADSTVEQFVSVDEVGRASFYAEASMPAEYQEALKREMENVKYIGAVGKISDVSTLVSSVASLRAVQQKLKAIAMIRELDYKSFFGDASKVATEFNGVRKQHERCKYSSQNVIDAKGGSLTPEMLSQIALVIQENYGDPSNIRGWVSPNDFTNYAKFMIKNKYFITGNSEVRNVVSVPRKFELADGEGTMETDLFLRYNGQSYIDRPHPKLTKDEADFAAMHKKAPNTATNTNATITPDNGGTIPAGIYDYAILAVNRYGAGKAVEIEGVTVDEKGVVTFPSCRDGGSPEGLEAESFELYRKKSGSGIKEYRYIKTFGSGETITDDGSKIPGSRTAFFFDDDPEQVYEFKQLLPMVKQPLAKIGDFEWWLQKLYGTPMLYNPNKVVIVENLLNVTD